VIDRCVIVTRKTQLQELLLQHNTVGQAEFFITRNGGDFGFIQKRHDVYMSALTELQRSIPPNLKCATIDRSFLPQFEFLEDMVIAIGQDGLVSNTAKYLDGQPLIGINPDPEFIEGILLPWRVDQFPALLGKVRASKHEEQRVTLAKAVLNDGRELLAFNDLFIGQSGHASSLYTITHGRAAEFQSSSGIIVSTGAGSTGWMRSINMGAEKIIGMSLGEFADIERAPQSLSRESDELVFAVREPWPSKKTGTSIVTGVVNAETSLTIESRMAANGVIFSDGIEWDYLPFNSGTIASIGIADKKAALVIP
jgi:hypothetical protein